jgi:hypothetical protein
VKVTVNLSVCVPRRHIRRSRTICSTDSWHTQGVSCTHPQLASESYHGTHWTGCWVGPGVGVDTMDKRQNVTPARNWTLDCAATAQSLYTSNYANPAPLFANIRQYPDTVNGSGQHSVTWLLLLHTGVSQLCYRGCRTASLRNCQWQTAAVPHIPRFVCQPTILVFLVSSLSFLPSACFGSLLCI